MIVEYRQPLMEPRRYQRLGLLAQVLLISATMLAAGCSLRSMVINSFADILAEGADVYASDEDPELVRDALPFNLKTLETLLQSAPTHPGLLLSACSTFTQYAGGFVQPGAEVAQWTDFDYATAEVVTNRSRKMYVRARDYCLRRVEIDYPGMTKRLQLDPDKAVLVFGREDVETMYWLGGSWGLAISLGLDQPSLAVDLPVVRALMGRAIELHEGYNRGALHSAFITLESVPELLGGDPERARSHFRRAVELSDGLDASPYVSLATGVSMLTGNRDEFESLLESALAIDPDEDESMRLFNIVSQRRARFLLDHINELFDPPLEP